MTQQKTQDILTFLERTKGLLNARRYRASLREGQNNAVEHSWRLALMVLIVGMQYGVKLDMGKALSLALLHDLAEAKTGDIDAYIQIAAGKQLTDQKAQAEESAMQEITSGLFFGQSVYILWREYEDQKTVEAKFVKALDKIEGFLHIAEEGVEAYIPKEFHADYADKAMNAFNETARDFPELNELLDAVKKDLREQFDKVGVKWIEGEKS
jgi:putative hydrolases of HD superfamily